ncbi:MFS transporter [Auritidibacter ignavus]|uniref:MFS transporter n=1 Tax=Auritidibacter ignavus TaxID=678932 RepID=UPI00109D7C4F|nr:MFS transporter [Auritidibacter ignavus]
MTTPSTTSSSPGTSDHGAGKIVPLSLGAMVGFMILLALNLRTSATAVGPVLNDIAESVELSAVGAGVLTSLPGLCFGALGFVAVRLAQQFGLTGGLTMGCGLILIGGLARVLTGNAWLFLFCTVVALSGIAIGNVLAPAWIKTHAGTATVGLMGTYSAVVTASGALGSLTAVPLAQSLGAALEITGWRATLGFWAVAAIVPGIMGILLWVRTGRDRPRAVAPSATSVKIYRSPLAWAMTGFFAFQSMNAYVQFGWLPQIYQDAGVSPAVSGALVSIMSAVPIIGGFVMPWIISRSKNISGWIIGLGLSTATGYLGLLIDPAGGAWIWAIFFGFGGWAFPTAIALIPARSRDPHVTARLSGFVQPIGYMIAATGPVSIGALFSATGSWTAPLIVMMATVMVLLICGFFVARKTTIESQLSRLDMVTTKS